ncbi:MAG: hypothetical protein AAFR91_00170 [Pseudomonadota bacterium]
MVENSTHNRDHFSGGLHTYLYDVLGSVRSLASETGSISDTYVYQAFGDVEVQNGTDLPAVFRT